MTTIGVPEFHELDLDAPVLAFELQTSGREGTVFLSGTAIFIADNLQPGEGVNALARRFAERLREILAGPR